MKLENFVLIFLVAGMSMASASTQTPLKQCQGTCTWYSDDGRTPISSFHVFTRAKNADDAKDALEMSCSSQGREDHAWAVTGIACQ